MAHILIIDDNEDMRLVCRKLLTHAGHKVAAVDCARSALDWLREHKRTANPNPCLVLLDLNMPGLSAADFVKEANEEHLLLRHDGSHVPVVLASGSFDIAVHARDMNVSGYLRKPFDLDELLDLVDRNCG